MGLVVDIHWGCPGCGEKNYAQGYGGWDDPEEGYNYKCVPLNHASSLKWSPACKKCGEYKLKETDISHNVEMTFEKVKP